MMINEIQRQVRETEEYLGKSELSEHVISAMRDVPRHEFVLPEQKPLSYENHPLPIGFGQTISQPYIVAIMTDLIQPDEDDVVLEIGTGSGYQAAILARVVESVFTIEIIPELAKGAQQTLARLGYENVTVREGDGYFGWPEAGPFDGIIVTAAGPEIPQPLIDQLKPGGRMILPLGGVFSYQELLLIEKGLDGEISSRKVLPVAFVPLTGEGEQKH